VVLVFKFLVLSFTLFLCSWSHRKAKRRTLIKRNFRYQKPAFTRVQKPVPAIFLVASDLDLLTPKQMGFQDSWWNISLSSLVITFLRYRAEKQTNIQTTVKSLPLRLLLVWANISTTHEMIMWVNLK